MGTSIDDTKVEQGASRDALTGRPRRSDPVIIRAAREDLAAEIDRDWPSSRMDAARWLSLLERAGILTHYVQNGFELAREIDRTSPVDPDRELVEILDGAYDHLSRAHKAAVRQWVKYTGTTLAHAVGDRVTCPHCTGTIVELRPETASYVVRPDEDPSARFSRGGGYVVEAERCAPSAAADA